MNETIIDKLKTIISAKLDVNFKPEDIDEDSPLFEEGLGLDSVIIVEFFALVEESFNIEFSDDDLSLEHLNTLKEIADCVANKL